MGSEINWTPIGTPGITPKPGGSNFRVNTSPAGSAFKASAPATDSFAFSGFQVPDSNVPTTLKPQSAPIDWNAVLDPSSQLFQRVSANVNYAGISETAGDDLREGVKKEFAGATNLSEGTKQKIQEAAFNRIFAV